MKIEIKKHNKGFTLLEMLVVVLIIGILAAVALPQYKKAVEKSKLSEALMNLNIMIGAMQRYMLNNPSTEIVSFKDFTDVELVGGEWNGDGTQYTTKDFDYNSPACSPASCSVDINRNNDVYTLAYDTRFKSCFTQDTDLGRYICKYLESQGWEYYDEEY